MARAIDVRCGSTKSRTMATELFMAEARKYNVLTADEELELINKAQAGDESAKTALVNHNLRFLFSLASKFAKGDEAMDLVSYATIGMYKAIDSYDATRGLRLLSYAVHWMRAEISEYYNGDAQLVRNKQQYKVAARSVRVNDKFFAENGRYPSEAELVEILNSEYNLELKKRSDVLRHSYTSLNSKIDEDGATLEEIGEVAIATACHNEVEDSIESEDRAHTLEKLLSTLPLRNRMILEMSVGMGDYEGIERDDDAIAVELGLTRERVRQIRLKSLATLKDRAKRILATA
jgi:RNA polymerase primary sigma factor